MNNATFVTISGITVPVYQRVIAIKHTSDLRSTCDFVVQDPTGSAKYSPRQPVQVIDSVRGVRFRGFISSVQYSNLNPQPDNQIKISCVDMRDLAEKAYGRRDYVNQLAGDIATDLHNNYLASLGVQAQYASTSPCTNGQWNIGTLSNVIGSTHIDDGDLELTPAGVEVTIDEDTTAEFATGTLTNLVAANNLLSITTQSALRMKGTSEQGANNNYAYIKFWSGSVVVATGDNLVYDVWVSSSSPKIVGGLDVVCSDGTTARDNGVTDQYALSSHPSTDLSGYANDQWFHRSCGLANLVGKTISYATIAMEGDANGDYQFFVSNAYLVDSTGTVKATLFNGTLAQSTLVGDIGYANIRLDVVTAYLASGTRISSYSLAGAGIVRNSIATWTQCQIVNGAMVTIPNDAVGSNNMPYSTLESSLDGGATWQTCTNHGAIPDLLPGLSAAMTLKLRLTVYVAGTDPTSATNICNLGFTVQPSYSNSNTASIFSGYSGSVNHLWDSQNHNNTMTDYIGNLTLSGWFRDWATDPNPLQGITLWGGGVTQGLGQPNSCYGVRCDPQTDGRARIDTAGQWGDCTIEVDVWLADAVGNIGIVYRCTGWQGNNNTYAYSVYITPTSVNLGKGTNSATGTGGFASIATVTVNLQTGNWYHLKVVAAGTSHKVYVNDVLYITATDATFTAAGYIGLRHFNGNASGGARHSGYFQNFGVVAAMSGVWTTNAVALSSLSTIGTSVLAWNENTPSNTSTLVEASVDNGTTWATATNGGAIPGLTTGGSASGKNLKLRATYTTYNANSTPTIYGMYAFITSAFNASGSRISPALSLNSVGVAGDTSLTWNGVQPTGTTLAIDTSPDGSTWTLAGSGASGSVTIPGIATQTQATDDSFDSDTHTLYTSTHKTGGTNGAWVWNTGQSRLEGTGNGSVLLYASISTADVDLLFDTDLSNTAGIVWRWTNASNFYELVVQDSQAQSNPNILQVYKTLAGVRAQIGSTVSIDFTRGTPHRVRLTMIGSTITASFDGVQVLSVTDTSLAGGGLVGMSTTANGTSSAVQFYQFRIQPLGQSVVGQSVYSRVRLASTDPTVTPQLQDLTLNVRSPEIQSGVLIPQTKYSVLAGSTNTLAADYDDAAKQSNFQWQIRMQDLHLLFQAPSGNPAPWIITSDCMLQAAQMDLTYDESNYRNVQFAIGGTDILQVSQQLKTDGITQVWSTAYPIASVDSITVDGVVTSVGIQGVDTGRDFYYTPGGTSFAQDTSATPYDDTQTVQLLYQGQSTAVVEMRDDAQIAQIRAIDMTDGIIEAAEDVSQQALNVDAMLQLCEARLTQYAKIIHTLIFSTNWDGLEVNQIAPVYLPMFQIADAQYLITSIAENIDAINTQYDVTCTDGASVYDYQHFLNDIMKK